MKTQNKKPLDLSKCKVGQKVRLRNGEIKIFLGSTLSSLYPFAAGKSIATYGTYTKNGRFNQDREGNIDIVAILPRAQNQACANRPDSQAAAETSTGLGAHRGGAGVSADPSEACGEMCVGCKTAMCPSLIEAGTCIFCIQKDTARQRDEAREENAYLIQQRNELWQEIAKAKHTDNGYAVLVEERDLAREELAKAQAQVLALREVVKKAIAEGECIDLSPCNGGTCEVATQADEKLDLIMYGLRQALSSTPPPAVPLEDVKVLTMALQELVKRDAHLLMPYTKIAHAALKTFITKHPQLNS